MTEFTDNSALLNKEGNAEQTAIIDKLGIPANQKLTAKEFVDLVVKPIRELQVAMGSVKDGEDGKSAYDIALDNGFVGTVTEWMASLKGVKGDSGAHVDDLVISHETGESTEAVMSQKAVTDKLNEKANQEDLSQLAHEVTKVVGINDVLTPTITVGGYIYSAVVGERIVLSVNETFLSRAEGSIDIRTGMLTFEGVFKYSSSPVSLAITDENNIVIFVTNETGLVNIPLDEYPTARKYYCTFSKTGTIEVAQYCNSVVKDTENMKDELKTIHFENSPILFSKIYGKYINSDGSFFSYDDGFYSKPIRAYKGVTYIFTGKGYSDGWGIISKTDSAGSYHTVVVKSVDSTVRDYTYTPDEDCYICVCGYTTAEHTLKANGTKEGVDLKLDHLQNKVFNIESSVMPSTLNNTPITFGIIENYYILATGGIQPNNACFMSEPIKVYKGLTYVFRGRGYSDGLGMISKTDAENSYHRVVVVSDGSDVKNYTYTATEDGYICVSGFKAYEHTLKASGKKEGLEEKVNALYSVVEAPPTIIVVKPNGGGDFTTIRAAIDDAVNKGCSASNPFEIQIHEGTYNLYDEMTDDEINNASYSGSYERGWCGVDIVDGMSLVGIGNKENIIIGCEIPTTYALSNREAISTFNLKGNCLLENLTITAKYIRYVIHDDFAINADCKHIAKNCNFIDLADVYGNGIAHAWGAAGKNGLEVYFENCMFSPVVSYHTTDDVTTPWRVTYKNCIAKGVFNISDMSNISGISSFQGFVEYYNCSCNAFSYSGTSQHVSVKMVGNSRSGMIFNNGINYDSDEIKYCRSSGSVEAGKAVKLVFSSEKEYNGVTLKVQKTTSINDFFGIAIEGGNNGDIIRVQTCGYIDIRKVGISSATNGELFGIDSNSNIISVNDKANAIAVCKFRMNGSNNTPSGTCIKMLD